MGQIVSDSISRYETTKTSNAINGLETNRNRTSDLICIFGLLLCRLSFYFIEDV